MKGNTKVFACTEVPFGGRELTIEGAGRGGGEAEIPASVCDVLSLR